MKTIRRIARFIVDFVVGDDWSVSAAVVVALAVTAALVHVRVVSWWPLPLAVILLLGVSLWRSMRPSGSV